jgi:hypothetical protein
MMTNRTGAVAATALNDGNARALKDLLWPLLCLLAVLTFLFAQSFKSATVLFANDAPLGALVWPEPTASGNFTGAWQPLNWIGSAHPSALPNVTYASYFAFGALGYAKFYVPFTLLLLGLSAWFCFRSMDFGQMSSVLGGLAAALTTDPFSYACWGLAPIAVCLAAIFAALGILTQRRRNKRWIQFCLAGLCVGMAVMEGYDVGAILSLYVAAFVLCNSLTERGAPRLAIGRGVARVAIVALFAAFISAHALSTLIGTQVTGIAGTQQDQKTKQEHWDEATMWSLPKLETLRLIIPGLFGYRMDTPSGGNYWGAVGQRPGVPQSRHSGSGVYVGLLVALLAGWAVARSFQKKDNPFSEVERKFIWFWAGAALISLLLAYGRHAPFYQFFYQLPYFSTIRNPIKFVHPFTVSLVILFAYGLEGLSRRYLQKPLRKAGSIAAQMKAWWSVVPVFDRRWCMASFALLAVSVLGWLVYSSSRSELERYIQSAGFSPELAALMARFSIIEVGWFVLFLALAVTALTLILSGGLSGSRSKWAGMLLGALLMTDLARANSPWIVYYNYMDKYATNPVIDLLREKPFEHRVAARLGPMTPNYLATDQARTLLGGVAEEWLQQHFQYYGIQSLDIVQMARMPETDAAFMTSVLSNATNHFTALGRLWQLTNTRYVLGMKGFLESLNQQFDPTNQSFRVLASFDFVPRAAATAVNSVEEITAVIRPEGQFAVFEFGAALPRAKLFTDWQVITNDDQGTLRRLADPAFNPLQRVLITQPVADAGPVSASTRQDAGSLTFTRYEPKDVGLNATAPAASVLLLNDKYSPDWEVSVDGKPAPLLRCNYIMRGVFLQPGNHVVEFHFNPPHATLYVSLAAIGLGIILCGILVARPRKDGDEGALEPAPAIGSTAP